VRRALSAYRPEVVLIEGPPEADPLVELAGDDDMRAPVALLAYPAAEASGGDRRARAVFWPFAEFSPEWQALRWAVAGGVPVRFIDLPAAVQLAAGAEPELPARRGSDSAGAAGLASSLLAPGGAESGLRADPIGALAAAAGYDDPERWWEDVVEHRLDEVAAGDELAAALGPFEAIAEAMTEVRAHAGAMPPPTGLGPRRMATERERLEEERREAAMRTALRAATKQFARVAVVCGAWHVPALRPPLPTATADAAVLRGLLKTKVAMTWVPWTHARLASGQGYGAGVRSPGWYHHLFTTPWETVPRWLVKAAGVLRRDGLPVSSAHVIEATRLADALATMRGRPAPGLTEVTDATLAVLCEGDELRLELVQRRLVVGERLGKVPDHTPGVPIARDVAASQRRLRLPPQPEPRDIDLDLRRGMDLERSRLLHRLGLLGVDWGVPVPGRRGGRGTFWESWRLGWQPEFAVDLVEASAYGTTVHDAASARVAEQAAAAASLADVTALVERCLLAELPRALPAVLRALDERIALDSDVAHLMDALPALARTQRYGDVRRTDLPALRHVTEGLITRVCVGLPAAVTALDDAAAAAMRDRVDAVQAAVSLLDEPELTTRWQETLVALSTRDDLHGLLAGRLNRLLLDAGLLDVAEAGRRMGLVLTIGVPVARAAAWIEGFLTGDGLLLVHDEKLLRLVDGWLTGIPADAFVEVLPLLRRTFSEYPAPQRRQIGERAVRLGRAGPVAEAASDDDVDPDRGDLVLPTVAALLGWGRS
jgi:hypothetical protein